MISMNNAGSEASRDWTGPVASSVPFPDSLGQGNVARRQMESDLPSSACYFSSLHSKGQRVFHLESHLASCKTLSHQAPILSTPTLFLSMNLGSCWANNRVNCFLEI